MPFDRLRDQRNQPHHSLRQAQGPEESTSSCPSTGSGTNKNQPHHSLRQAQGRDESTSSCPSTSSGTNKNQLDHFPSKTSGTNKNQLDQLLFEKIRENIRPPSYNLLSLKPGKDDDRDEHHDTEGNKISILPPQLRHIIEVHPIDPGDEGKGEEEG